MVDSSWTGKDHSSRGNCYSDWTVQKGRAQSHCHELHPSDAKNHFVLYYLVLLFSASPQARICEWTPPSPGKETQSYYPKNATRRATRPRPGHQISHTLITPKPNDPAIGPQDSARPGIQIFGPEIQTLTRPPCSQPGPRTLTPAQSLGPRRGPDRNLSCPVHGLVS